MKEDYVIEKELFIVQAANSILWENNGKGLRQRERVMEKKSVYIESTVQK